ncbi:MAG: PqqD family protein [Clostridia bacterium]|nr:PqqD family protein [Clostridia bacterium]
MKIKPGYLLREVAGNYIVVAIGEEAVDFNGVITVNDVGAFIWKKLEAGAEPEEIVKAILSEYDVDEKAAAADTADFIEKLRKAELLV